VKYECGVGGVRSWHQRQRFGQLCQLLLWNLNTLQWVFQKSFPLEADHFHPFKQVANFVVSAAAKGNQELVGTELDVVAHHG
jgi:hypothetical protein